MPNTLTKSEQFWESHSRLFAKSDTDSQQSVSDNDRVAREWLSTCYYSCRYYCPMTDPTCNGKPLHSGLIKVILKYIRNHRFPTGFSAFCAIPKTVTHDDQRSCLSRSYVVLQIMLGQECTHFYNSAAAFSKRLTPEHRVNHLWPWIW